MTTLDVSAAVDGAQESVPGGSVVHTGLAAWRARVVRVFARPALYVVAVTALGLGYYVHASRYEDTDDAQVDSEVADVGPEVVGVIAKVHVSENQLVHAGDPLVELDTRELENANALALANVALAEAQLRSDEVGVDIVKRSSETSVASSEATLRATQADIVAAERRVSRLGAEVTRNHAKLKQATLDRDRAQALFDTGAVARAELDLRSNDAAASAAALSACEEEVAEARAFVNAQAQRVLAARARLLELSANAPLEVQAREASALGRRASLAAARAALAQAELNLARAKVVSPVDGVIARKVVSVGDHAAPGQQMFAIAALHHVWVTANFRETQLEKIHPGQSVEVFVDALDKIFTGTVDSIGGATGSRISMLPPENAVGNYVKVIQRLPVRIRLAPNQAGLDRLRPGMSVVPKVRL